MRPLLFLLAALLLSGGDLTGLHGGFSLVSPAQADDDDGGGDDSDDGGAGGSASSRDGGGSSQFWQNRGARPREKIHRRAERPRAARRAPRREKAQVQRQAPKREQARRRRAPAAPAAPPPIAVPGEIVVAEVSAADLTRIAEAGFVVLSRQPLSLVPGEIARLRAPDELSLDAARERIRDIAPTAIVDDNHLYRPVEMPCGPGACPAFEMIGWALPPARCALTPTIGMIDTVVNTEHEALRGQAIEIVSVVSETETASAAVHGTAIAALLVGDGDSRTPGLLPQARLVAVEAFHRDSAGDAADVYKIVRGLDALSERAVRVVNLSFAGPANVVLERAVKGILDKRMIAVAAAGNLGPDAPPAYPGAYDGVISVTAVDRQSRIYRQAGRGDHVDLAAPGVRIWTAASVSGGKFRSGTSYAVPFVTASAAVALSKAPESGPADILDGLSAGSGDLGDTGRDAVFGWGLVKALGC